MEFLETAGNDHKYACILKGVVIIRIRLFPVYKSMIFIVDLDFQIVENLNHGCTLINYVCYYYGYLIYIGLILRACKTYTHIDVGS